MIVVTGLSGSGKTSIMKNSKFANQVFLDEWVKRKLYRKFQKGYRLIKKHFGPDYLKFCKVDTAMLRDVVINDPAELTRLNELIQPLVKKYLHKLSEKSKNIIIEQATYIPYENEFKNFYDKVVLIKRKQSLRKPKNNLISEKNIKVDATINNNGVLLDSVHEYERIIDNFFSYKKN